MALLPCESREDGRPRVMFVAAFVLPWVCRAFTVCLSACCVVFPEYHDLGLSFSLVRRVFHFRCVLPVGAPLIPERTLTAAKRVFASLRGCYVVFDQARRPVLTT